MHQRASSSTECELLLSLWPASVALLRDRGFITLTRDSRARNRSALLQTRHSEASLGRGCGLLSFS
jgi:hypothetical protein